jgi:hypothetical protein
MSLPSAGAPSQFHRGFRRPSGHRLQPTARIAPPQAAAPRLEEWENLAAVVNLMARVNDAHALLERVQESHDDRLHIGYSEAAKRLNIPEKWLRERITTLPHRKLGKFVQFTEEDLRAISDMHFVNPGHPDEAKTAKAAPSPLRPSSRARSRSWPSHSSPERPSTISYETK